MCTSQESHDYFPLYVFTSIVVATRWNSLPDDIDLVAKTVSNALRDAQPILNNAAHRAKVFAEMSTKLAVQKFREYMNWKSHEQVQFPRPPKRSSVLSSQPPTTSAFDVSEAKISSTFEQDLLEPKTDEMGDSNASGDANTSSDITFLNSSNVFIQYPRKPKANIWIIAALVMVTIAWIVFMKCSHCLESKFGAFLN